MTLLLVCVAIAVVGGVAVLVARDRPVLDDDPVDARRLEWPPAGPALAPGDLAEARFTVAVRGYRMDEVDLVIADAAEALAERDRLIAELEQAVAAHVAARDADAEHVTAEASDVDEAAAPTVVDVGAGAQPDGHVPA